jgi:hypothetical protein
MDYDDHYDYESDYGGNMNQIMVISVLRMKTVFKQQILVTLTLHVTQTRMQMLVWTGNNGRRYVLGMRSPPLRAPTQISGMRLWSVATLSNFASFVTAHGKGKSLPSSPCSSTPSIS